MELPNTNWLGVGVALRGVRCLAGGRLVVPKLLVPDLEGLHQARGGGQAPDSRVQQVGHLHGLLQHQEAVEGLR